MTEDDRRIWTIDRAIWTVDRGVWMSDRSIRDTDRGVWILDRSIWGADHSAWTIDRSVWMTDRGIGSIDRAIGIAAPSIWTTDRRDWSGDRTIRVPGGHGQEPDGDFPCGADGWRCRMEGFSVNSRDLTGEGRALSNNQIGIFLSERPFRWRGAAFPAIHPRLAWVVIRHGQPEI